ACLPATCTSDRECAAPLRCDSRTHRCAACISDGDCAVGLVCDPVGGTCMQGCAADHGCGDGGRCEVDAGRCVECLVRGDCNDPARGVCDLDRHRCAACWSGNDTCGPGTYCGRVGGGDVGCSAGCKDDADCAGDGGPSAHCDVATHRCVDCTVD